VDGQVRDPAVYSESRFAFCRGEECDCHEVGKTSSSQLSSRGLVALSTEQPLKTE
jgi:hypothetical protein